MTPTRRREFGDKGEALAEDFLKKLGYTVVSKNYRVGNLGEIDIIVRKKKEYVFCEVKTRDVAHEATFPIGFSIDTRKRKALRKACEIYLAESGKDNANWRVDAVLISIDLETNQVKNIEHIENILWERYY